LLDPLPLDYNPVIDRYLQNKEEIMDILTDRTNGTSALYETSNAKKTSPADDIFAAAAASGDDVEAEISTTGLLINQLNDRNLNTSSMIAPTLDNLRRLTSELAPLLGEFTAKNKIATEPPLEFQIEPSGKLALRGDRADENIILQQLAANPQLERAVRNTTAIASHAYTLQVERHYEFQQAYRASNNPAAVVAKYSELFGPPKNHDISLRFGSDGVSIIGDQQVWQAVKPQDNTKPDAA
jgi:hypothetical protein